MQELEDKQLVISLASTLIQLKIAIDQNTNFSTKMMNRTLMITKRKEKKTRKHRLKELEVFENRK
jgi:hypothetical protein